MRVCFCSAVMVEGPEKSAFDSASDIQESRPADVLCKDKISEMKVSISLMTH